MADITKADVVEFIKEMSVLDLSEFITELEDTFGVSAAAPMAVAVGGGAAGGDEPAAEEQTEFDVIMTSFGEKKIQVIKAVRSITTLGLKEAKALVEEVPASIKEAISKDEADEIVKQIEEAGGIAEVK